MNFFSAWTEVFKPAPVSLQTFTLNLGQERQFVNWYTTPETLAFAEANPGQIYIIGDEPDQFCQTSTEYAAIYNAGVVAIRAVDPTARFSPAGFAEPNSVCAGDPYAMHSIGYAEKFYNEYTRQFGSPPPVYEWRFHDFALNNTEGDIAGWLTRISTMAGWSVAHGAKMYLGSWGFLGWRNNIESIVKTMKKFLQDDSRITGACWWSYDAWVDSSHPLFENGQLTSIGQSYIGEAQMTLEERISFLETVVGIKWATTHPVEADLVPANYLPDDRYPLMLSDYQIRLGIAKVEAKLVESTPGTVETPDLVVDILKVTKLYIGDKQILASPKVDDL